MFVHNSVKDFVRIVTTPKIIHGLNNSVIQSNSDVPSVCLNDGLNNAGANFSDLIILE